MFGLGGWRGGDESLDLGEEGGVTGMFVVESKGEFGGFLEGAAELEDGFGGGGVGGWGYGNVLSLQSLCQSCASLPDNIRCGALVTLG